MELWAVEDRVVMGRQMEEGVWERIMVGGRTGASDGRGSAACLSGLSVGFGKAKKVACKWQVPLADQLRKFRLANQ
jgi:hypothetical protein